MMKLRKYQIDALLVDQIEAFKQEVTQHLAQFFADKCETMGRSGVIEFIDDGIELAAKHGICEKRDVSRIIDIMFVLGRHFDRDPNLLWAREILGRKRFASARVDELCDATAGYIRMLSSN